MRLWHISRRECLCCFQHIDFVTAIAFHPRDDRYFLSGSLDGKLRLWNIPDKKVALWNEVDGQTKLVICLIMLIAELLIVDNFHLERRLQPPISVKTENLPSWVLTMAVAFSTTPIN